MMPDVVPAPSDIGFMFGTRHGVDEFCSTAYSLWQARMFGKLLISGGTTPGEQRSEAEVIAERLIAMGMPASSLILETVATNTGENVILGRKRIAEVMDLASIKTVLVIGKVCSTRRYLMTMKRHWPEVKVYASPVNYFGMPTARWNEHDDFRARVVGEFSKIPDYVQRGFLTEVEGYPAYPDVCLKTTGL
ncbi:YdcF family protein [Massilia polaris]|nr:YdcF family protein [Massilia polaris]